MIGLSNAVRFVRHDVCVDNMGVMGCSRDDVARVVNKVISIFETVGLAVHGLEMSGGEMKVLGVELDNRLLRTAVTRERYWKLHGHFLTSGKANGKMLDVLFGHCSCAALVRRPVLSVFRCVLVHSG